MFPRGYATSEWLAVLSDLGLRKDLGKDLLTRAAARVASQARKKVQLGDNVVFERKRLASKAHRLILHFFSNFSDLFSNEVLAELSEISFVPVTAPIRVARAFENGSDGDSSTSSGREGTAVLCFVRFRDCALHKDRHLAWTVKPILPKALEPPRTGTTSIKNKRCPRVLDHLRTFWR